VRLREEIDIPRPGTTRTAGAECSGPGDRNTAVEPRDKSHCGGSNAITLGMTGGAIHSGVGREKRVGEADVCAGDEARARVFG
jgi:hypothetical protein